MTGRPKYPRRMRPKRVPCERLYDPCQDARCDGCGGGFGAGDIVVVCETQVNEFRDDDLVKFYHERCHDRV